MLGGTEAAGVIVVTGASGYVGGLVVAELARRGHAVRALVRDLARAPRLAGVEARAADYGDAASLDAALEPGDRVFMVSMHQGPAERIALHRAFVDAAVRRRVGHVTYLSFLHAGAGARFIHARSHGATEAMLRASGLAWTSVRNGMYADDIAGWFDADGVAREPGGAGALSFSYRPELAEAIAVILTTEGHAGRTYNVVARDAVDLAELAAIAAELTGAPYRYEPADDAFWLARWRADGANEWQLAAGTTSYEALRAGELCVASDDFRALTGREPLSVRELFARLPGELPLGPLRP